MVGLDLESGHTLEMGMPQLLGKCTSTYCTKRDGRSRSRFKNDTFGIPLDLEILEGLDVAPGLRWIRPKEKKKQSVTPAISPAQPITPSLDSVGGFSTKTEIPLLRFQLQRLW